MVNVDENICVKMNGDCWYLADGDLLKVGDPAWLDDLSTLGDLLVAAGLSPAKKERLNKSDTVDM